ncbi:MAG TPA: tetratricopeptide repeat protein [Acidimicrobiia bacterium]|nr:tetratricopeptide repeat protein [Acidimicrobiia bacterium]
MTATRELPGHLPVTTRSEEARRYFQVGRMMAFQYQSRRAVAALDAAIAADPTFVLAYLHRGGMSDPVDRGEYFEQARAHREVVTDDEGLMVDAFHAFLWEPRVDDAIAIFTDLAERYPSDPYLPTYLGLRYLHNLGKPAEARAQFERALERDPEFVPARLWLGQVALQAGTLDEAERHFTAYLDRAPQEPRAHDCIGLLRQRQGLYDEAAASYRAALDRDPEFTDSHTHLVGVAIERALKRLERAVENGDADTAESTYTTVARVFLPGTPTLEGRVSVAQHWAASPNRLTLETTELHVSADGQYATEVGRFRMGDGPQSAGNHMTIWAQTVDGWKIHRSMWSSD